MNLQEAISRLSSETQPRGELASLKSPDYTWDLSLGFAKAAEMAARGWDAQAGALWKSIFALAMKIESGVQEYYDVSGESVDVGRYLSGEPECMLAQSISPLSSVSVFINISAKSNADAEQLFNRGIAVAAVIHALQSSGRGVALVVCESVSCGESIHETFIQMQDFGEYINPGRLAFWAAHPAALRRCIFRYNEQQDPEIRDRLGFKDGWGYGSPRDIEIGKLPQGTVYIPFAETEELRRHYASPRLALKRVVEEFKAKGVPIEIQNAAGN